VVIVSTARTPIGSYGKSLKSFSAPQLGALAIRGAVDKINLSKSEVQEVIMGNVVSANLGQAPARQASVHAGLPYSVCATTVNKMCASGMKSVMMAAQNIMLGQRNCVIAGGMESMSNTPHYVTAARWGTFGDSKLVDGILRDGLTDAFSGQHMGNCAELCAKTYNFSREEQDAYAIESYKRSKAATEGKKFQNEILSVSVEGRKGQVSYVTEDEEYKNINFDKVPQLRSAFQKDGTVTAANSSTLSDGGSALVLMSESKAKKAGFTPLARIRGFADAERLPEEFTIAPSDAVPLALKHAGINKSDVDLFELNEAFSVVALANMRILDLDPSTVNIYGGAVSLGHPIGNSGSRILCTLLSALQNENKTIGVAGICNGGGGASAVVIERL